MSKEVEWGKEQGEGAIVCTCDACSNTYEYEFYDGPDFKACQSELRREGWSSRNIDGEWYDFCCEACKVGTVRSDNAADSKSDFTD